MNFEFSEEQKLVQQQARQFLTEQSPLSVVREVLERDASQVRIHEDVWQGIVKLGWPGVAIDEQYGGLGMGYLELCVLAEELGRSLAPTPFSSTVYLAAEALLLAGTEAQKERWLPAIATGGLVAGLAFVEATNGIAGQALNMRWQDGGLQGRKTPVFDAEMAQLLVVSAINEAGEPGFYLLETDQPSVRCESLTSIDPTRSIAAVEFSKAAADPMRQDLDFAATMGVIQDRAAVLFAFEQLGGAQACLEMATDYTRQRYAFGRPIASFQALKHKMADMFVAIELARSNAYYGAWSLSTGSDDLTEAACVARLSASDAYYQCSKENMQAHGGMGYTWELDCHLYYRRAQHLASVLGRQAYWKDRLIAEVA